MSSFLLVPASSYAKKCPGDSVQVGDACVDKYEASVWDTPPSNTSVITKIKKGKILAAGDLVGATQHGVASDDYGVGCPDTGNDCVDYYAVSVVGVTPSRRITWFQAAAACRNAGKHLATNIEWQAAAFGTPDTGGADNGTTDCNTDGLIPGVGPTGARSSCVSDVGAFDMVGNLAEWVADWVPASTASPGWGGLSDDRMGLSGASTTATGPGALYRGGAFNYGTIAGPFTVDGFQPSFSSFDIGFRCARHL